MKMLSKKDARLKMRSEEVNLAQDGIKKYKEILTSYYSIRGGHILGCSLPQFGILKRMCFVKTPTLGKTILVNPVVLDISEELVKSKEGCETLGGKDVQFVVDRPSKITLKWTDTDGKEYNMELGAADARIIMHEIDHLNGELLCNKGRRVR